MRKPSTFMQASFALLALILFCVPAHAAVFANQPLTYTVKNDEGKLVTVEMPFVVSDNKVAADRINIYLHMTLLETLPPLDSNKLSASRVIEYRFPLASLDSSSVELNNGGRVVTVRVHSEGCAAYCTESENVFNFDARTGRVPIIDDLITPDAKPKIAALEMKANAKTLREEITLIQKAVHDKSSMLNEEDSALQLEMYQKCLADGYTPGGEGYAQNLKDPGGIGIGEGQLVFSKGGCGFYHAIQALDDLGDFSLTLAEPQLRPYLSPYGQYLMLGLGDGTMPAINPYGQIFQGKINHTIGVTLYLVTASSGTDGAGSRYFYNKFGKMIELSLARYDDWIELTEAESTETPKPVLRFQIKGQKLVGEWRDGGKVYPFEAAP